MGGGGKWANDHSIKGGEVLLGATDNDFLNYELTQLFHLSDCKQEHDCPVWLPMLSPIKLPHTYFYYPSQAGAVTAVFVFRPFRPHQPTWQEDCLAPWCSDYSDFIGLNTWQVLQTDENVLLTKCLEPWLVLEVFFFSFTSLLLALELVSRKRQVVAAVKKNSRSWGRRWSCWRRRWTRR